MKAIKPVDVETPVYRLRAAASYLGCGVSTLCRWIKEGRIRPPHRPTKSFSYWLKEELDDFLANCDFRRQRK